MVVNVPPTLTITLPATDTIVSRGWRVALAYVDDDPDDVATTRLFADADGDVTTTNDQYPLSDARADQNGAPQELVSELTGLPEGEYQVIGVTADVRNAPRNARAPGKLIVSDVAWATHARSRFFVGSVATLVDGSSIVTGLFEDVATFATGAPNQTTLTAAGSVDMFVARYAVDGSFTWAKRAGGTGPDGGHGVAALADGSSVVTGSFEGTATFGEGEPNETTLTAAGGEFDKDVFVARYAPDGTLAWVKRAGGGRSFDSGYGIVLRPDQAFMVVGAFNGDATFGPGEANETVLTSSRSIAPDLFLARYATDGSLDWVISAGAGAGLTSKIVGLPDGAIVVLGDVFGSATLGPGQQGETRLTAAGGEFDQDVFVARFGADGSLAWARRAGGESTDSGQGIAAFPDGSSVVTGSFWRTATFGEGDPNRTVLDADGDNDIFVARYDATGSLTWARRAGGSARSSDIKDEGRAIVAMADGSCVVTGGFSLGAVFGAGEPNQSVLYADGRSGQANAFVARYAADGSLGWAKRVGCPSGSTGSAIAGQADGSVIVSGTFIGTATFGPGEPRQTQLDENYFAAFVARFNADGGF
ncbi:MAG: DUF2795 domain-containing protein [Planctomycetota bacterium]